MLLTSAIDAAPVESVHNEYYTIYPQTPYDILRELDWRSPVREKGLTFHGNTDWSISWRFKTQKIAGSCKLFDIHTLIDIKYTLPVLDKHIQNKNTIKRFTVFSNALVRHEHNHGLNGKKAAREIDDALRALRPEINCTQLEQAANNLGRSIVQKYTAIDNEYDRVTQNGRTEGAFINQEPAGFN